MKRVLPSIYPEGPQHYWAVMRALNVSGPFAIADVHAMTNGPRLSTVKCYVLALAKMGFIESAGTRPTVKGGIARLYRIVRDQREAPIRKPARTARGEAQQNLWTAMRALRQFRVAELAVAASTDTVPVKIATARAYCRALARADYIAPVGRCHWRLLPRANTGPLCPALTIDGLVDRNLQRPVNVTDFGRAA